MKFICQEEGCRRNAILNTFYCKWHLINKLITDIAGNKKIFIHIFAILLGYDAIYSFYNAKNLLGSFLYTRDIIYLLFILFDMNISTMIFVPSLIIILEKWSRYAIFPKALVAYLGFYPINGIYIILIKMYIDPTSLKYLNLNTVLFFDNFTNLLIFRGILSIFFFMVFIDLLRNNPFILKLYANSDMYSNDLPAHKI